MLLSCTLLPGSPGYASINILQRENEDTHVCSAPAGPRQKDVRCGIAFNQRWKQQSTRQQDNHWQLGRADSAALVGTATAHVLARAAPMCGASGEKHRTARCAQNAVFVQNSTHASTPVAVWTSGSEVGPRPWRVPETWARTHGVSVACRTTLQHWSPSRSFSRENTVESSRNYDTVTMHHSGS